jgi:glycosyltransferase involved in cell wall biosynthesis
LNNSLAIIIPFYKLTFFEATLKSLANQTNKQFNVYIGNDFSPEDCSDLIASYSDRIKIHYTRFETNLGGVNLVAQWERCLAMVGKESWVQFLGDDDLVSENFVSLFYEALPKIYKTNLNVIRASTYVINADGAHISKQFTHPVLESAPIFFQRKFNKETRSSLSEYMFRKSIVLEKQFKSFHLAWHSDDMAVFEFSDDKDIFSVNAAHVSVRVSHLNITGDPKNYVLKNLATFQFMEVLFADNARHFSKAQKIILLKKLEMACYNIPTLNHFIKVLELNSKYVGVQASFRVVFRRFKYKITRVLKRLHVIK